MAPATPKAPKRVEFKFADTSPPAFDPSSASGMPKIVVRSPTADFNKLLGGANVSPDSNAADAESSNASADEFSHSDESRSIGTATPTSSRSNSPSSSPSPLPRHAQHRDQNFEYCLRDTPLKTGGRENEPDENEPDALQGLDAPNSKQSVVRPVENPELLAIRGPEIDANDIENATAGSPYPPSEAAVTDRGEGAWSTSARKTQVLTDAHTIESSDEQNLSDLLEDAMVHRSGRVNADFMPKGKLEVLVNVETVERELRKATGFDIWDGVSMRTWAEIICGKRSRPVVPQHKAQSPTPKAYQKIFALLVWKEKPEGIFGFVQEDVNDSDLPLAEYVSAKDGTSSPYCLRRKNDATRPIQCFSGWRIHRIRDFSREQWRTLSPFFARGEHKNVRHYKLEDEDILPFTYDSRDDHGPGKQSVLERGGFGEVFKVRIHPDHHSFGDTEDTLPSSQDRDFAVKRLYSTNEKEWRSEIEILKRFSSNTHTHLISLLATYEKECSVHLIFHWADADLQKYWKEVNKMPEMDRTTVRWVSRQCHGIASGIVAIHQHVTSSLQDMQSGKQEKASAEGRKNDQLYGRHGDIKPRNILWFKNAQDPDGKGALVITDFGIAEMNSKNSRSGKSNQNIKFSRTYCAPESHIPGGEISRSYDVWTLGCLYLEFLTWLLGGWSYVAKFTRIRMKPEKALPTEGLSLDWFFELITDKDNCIDGAKVKEEVTSFIAELHSHPKCTDFVHDFLKLIEEELLIVETSQKYRFTSQQICTELNMLEKKVEIDEAYALKPTPWDSDGCPQTVSDTAGAVEMVTGSVSRALFSKRATY